MNLQQQSIWVNTISGHNDYLQAAQNAAATRAYQLAARTGMSREDREEIKQELLTDLLAQSQHYDSTRGSLGTFTGVVSKNRATELLDRYMKDKKHLTFVSTVAANDGSEEQWNLLDKGDVIPLWAVDDDLFDLSMALRDLDKAVRCMNTEQQNLFELLLTEADMASACRAYHGSAATFYRRVSDLKMHLRMFGIKATD
jgi:hypothetical protein